jgi:hypothetical protein
MTIGSFESAWVTVAPRTSELIAAAVASFLKNLMYISLIKLLSVVNHYVLSFFLFFFFSFFIFFFDSRQSPVSFPLFGMCLDVINTDKRCGNLFNVATQKDRRRPSCQMVNRHAT